MKPCTERILSALEELEVVDAHEHLPPETIRINQNVDVFTLFSHYTRVDLLASGMPTEYWDAIHDATIPIKKRWTMFRPYFKHIRYGSYARPAFIAANEFYGFEDINERTYKALSERIAADNTPGIYHRILREKCKIRVALTQADRTDYDFDLLVPLMPLDMFAAVRSKQTVEHHAIDLDCSVKNLDDYIVMIQTGLEKWKSDGVVGIKMRSFPYHTPNQRQATAQFDKIMRRESNSQLPQPFSKLFPERNQNDLTLMQSSLYPFLLDAILEMAANLELVVAVHTGMWGDFRVIDPQHLIPIVSKHPRTRFDIYHLGIPYIRETAILGKNFPNVWLNLCWCHIISPRIACLALDELIDLVPMNKIIAFGGDYNLPVEKVYGHLVMAKEDVARVLGRRVAERLLTEDEAIEIAKMWFYDNPKDLYRLQLE